jgi:hypothetical protein
MVRGIANPDQTLGKKTVKKMAEAVLDWFDGLISFSSERA